MQIDRCTRQEMSRYCLLPVFYMSVAPCLTTIKQITYDKDFTFFIFDGCDKIRQESGENMLISVEHLSKRQNIK